MFGKVPPFDEQEVHPWRDQFSWKLIFARLVFRVDFFFANANVTTFCIDLFSGLFEKWSTLDAKDFYAIPFQKLVFLISLYPEFLEKKQ